MVGPEIKKLTQIDHILCRPDMYIGTVKSKNSLEYIYENGKIIQKNITSSSGLMRIFIEVLSNAFDNFQRSRDAGMECTKIKINIDKTTGEIRVLNNGLYIPIEYFKDEHGKEEKYKHSVIFGELLTSTNFDDDEERFSSGRNGVGVKLTNVYSKFFRVRGADPEKKKLFSQVWKDNMHAESKPKIKDYTGNKGYTEISWIADLERFGFTEYTDDIIAQFVKYIYDIAMLTGIKIYYNDELIHISFSDYVKMYIPDGDEISPYYFETSDSKVGIIPSLTYAQISFVNGIYTPKGGVHIDEWVEKLLRPIVDKYTSDEVKIKLNDVKNFYMFFISSKLPNPSFDSQSKEYLVSPKPKIDNLSDKKHKSIVKKLLTWSDGIKDLIESKELSKLKKSATTKNHKIHKYVKANEAGGKNSKYCTLAVCEGNSASAFIEHGIDEELLGRKGKDWLGYLPIRGKFLNVRNATTNKIADNQIIMNLIHALGLKYGIDYTSDDNFKTLNYGKLLIMTDADADGKHIAALLINFIHKLFPSLLRREEPFIYDMRTPIAKFFLKGGREEIFYDLYDADQFYLQNEALVTDKKYYKGLGGNNDLEVQDVFGKRIITYVTDDNLDFVMNHIFGKKEAEYRKEWLNTYSPEKNTFLDKSTLTKAISDFINEEFILYGIDACVRSLPSVCDGLKISQRKIVFAYFEKRKKEFKSVKVAQFAGYTAEVANYTHGENNIAGTIINMTQSFVNSNNIPYFKADGQFGTRKELGGDSASPRYIFLMENDLIDSIYIKDDLKIVKKKVDDGDICEPEFYLPIIPMILVNGCSGIGLGWSTTIPLYNPLDLVDAIKDWLASGKPVNDKESKVKFYPFKDISPWYRNFTGEIIPTDRKKFTCTGVVNRLSKNKVEVTEIPVDMSVQSFREYLSDLEGSSIKSVKDYSRANKIKFDITEYNDGMTCNVTTLKLKSSIALSNMIAFDKDGKIKKYESVEEILEEFCVYRFPYYHTRKVNILLDFKNSIARDSLKCRFIKDVVSKKLIISNRKKQDIYTDMKKMKYEIINDDDEPYSFLLKMEIGSLTMERVEKLEEQVKKNETEYRRLVDKKEEDMWIEDLDNFVVEYTKWLKNN